MVFTLSPCIVSLCGQSHHPLNLNTIKSVLGFVGGLILALLIGNATHLIWDGLTHHDFRSFAFQDFLAQSVQLGTGIYPMHRVLQIGSSILALPFLLWMSLHYYRKHRQVSSVSTKIRVYAIGSNSSCRLYVVVFHFGIMRVISPMRLGKPNCITLRDVPSMSLAKVRYSC